MVGVLDAVTTSLTTGNAMHLRVFLEVVDLMLVSVMMLFKDSLAPSFPAVNA